MQVNLMYIYLYVYEQYVCMYVRTYGCMYVFGCVCMYLSTYVRI